MKLKQLSLLITLSLISVVIIPGCKQFDDFTAYFNTYYNAERLLGESEDEFEYQEEKKRVTPRVFVPEPDFNLKSSGSGLPPFMQEYVISQQKLQPVKIKLDSITIKGSKLLAKHPNSKYIEGTLFLMAKSYFYQGLWLPSQIKCSELVDRYPDGDAVPDALLLWAKNLLMQQNYESGLMLLSRAVDYAWMKERWDILSEAFRLEAEVALLNKDIDGALRPYKQAIAQSENDNIRAKWQVDMAAIYYREERFAEAEKAFAQVHKYSPDYVAEYEAYLYQAMCLIRLDDTTKAEKILKRLENDGKYEEWKNFVLFARLTKYRLYDDEKHLQQGEKFADSAYVNNQAINAAYFEKAIALYKQGNYTEARRLFSRARTQRSSFSGTSHQMFFILNSWDGKQNVIAPILASLDSGQVVSDTLKILLAQHLFELGRIHEELNNPDSINIYYYLATLHSPSEDTNTARYLHAYARVVRDSSHWVADSLLEVIVDKYPLTVYGQDAMIQLGYTDQFIIDQPYDIYKSGNNLRTNKEFKMAISQYWKLYIDYPDYKLTPKALYSIGWIFENDLKDIDSALTYYNLLIQKYPNSIYAQDIVSGVNYLTGLQKGTITPDDQIKEEYYKAPVLNLDEISNREVLTPAEQNPNQVDESLNPLDVFKDPSKMINKVIDTFKDTGKQIKESIDEVKDPSKLLDNIKLPKFDIPKAEGAPQDSTKTNNNIETPPPTEKKPK